MKKVPYRWLYPFFMALLMLGTLWFVAEPETHSHIPRNTSILLFSVAGLIVSCYALAVPFRFVFRYMTNRNKVIKPVIEYSIVIILTIFFISLITIIFNLILNPQPFFQRISWYDLVRNNGLVTPLVFLIYLYRRNALIKEEYNRQTLQLEEIKSYQNKYIFVKSNKQLKKIYLKDILFIESMENYVTVFTTSSKEVVYSSLKLFLESLQNNCFLQVHRSYVVNTEHIHSIDDNMLHIASYKIPVARNLRNQVFTDILNNRLVAKYL